jgi:hypothetical protein
LSPHLSVSFARAGVTYRRMLGHWLTGDAVNTGNAADTEQIAEQVSR